MVSLFPLFYCPQISTVEDTSTPVIISGLSVELNKPARQNVVLGADDTLDVSRSSNTISASIGNTQKLSVSIKKKNPLKVDFDK